MTYTNYNNYPVNNNNNAYSAPVQEYSADGQDPYEIYDSASTPVAEHKFDFDHVKGSIHKLLSEAMASSNRGPQTVVDEILNIVNIMANENFRRNVGSGPDNAATDLLTFFSAGKRQYLPYFFRALGFLGYRMHKKRYSDVKEFHQSFTTTPMWKQELAQAIEKKKNPPVSAYSNVSASKSASPANMSYQVSCQKCLEWNSKHQNVVDQWEETKNLLANTQNRVQYLHKRLEDTTENGKAWSARAQELQEQNETYSNQIATLQKTSSASSNSIAQLKGDKQLLEERLVEVQKEAKKTAQDLSTALFNSQTQQDELSKLQNKIQEYETSKLKSTNANNGSGNFLSSLLPSWNNANSNEKQLQLQLEMTQRESATMWETSRLQQISINQLTQQIKELTSQRDESIKSLQVVAPNPSSQPSHQDEPTVAELMSERDGWVLRMAASEVEKENLLKRIESLTAQLLSSNKEKEELKSENEVIGKEYMDAYAVNKTLGNQNQELNNRVSFLQKEAKEFHSLYEQARNENIRLVAEIQALKSANNNNAIHSSSINNNSTLSNFSPEEAFLIKYQGDFEAIAGSMGVIDEIVLGFNKYFSTEFDCVLRNTFNQNSPSVAIHELIEKFKTIKGQVPILTLFYVLGRMNSRPAFYNNQTAENECKRIYRLAETTYWQPDHGRKKYS